MYSGIGPRSLSFSAHEESRATSLSARNHPASYPPTVSASLNLEHANSVDSVVPAVLQADLRGEMWLVADRAHRVPAAG